MGAHPINRAGYRPIDDGYRAPVRRLVDKTERLPGCDLAHDFFAIFLRTAAQAAAADAIANDVDQRRTGLHNLRRKLVHRAILFIANDQPAVDIEQDDALRHVVQSQRQQPGIRPPGLATDQTIEGPEHGASRLKVSPIDCSYRTSIYASLINSNTHPAVDHEQAAGGEAGSVGGEKQHRARDFLRAYVAVKRDDLVEELGSVTADQSAQFLFDAKLK